MKRSSQIRLCLIVPPGRFRVSWVVHFFSHNALRYFDNSMGLNTGLNPLDFPTYYRQGASEATPKYPIRPLSMRLEHGPPRDWVHCLTQEIDVERDYIASLYDGTETYLGRRMHRQWRLWDRQFSTEVNQGWRLLSDQAGDESNLVVDYPRHILFTMSLFHGSWVGGMRIAGLVLEEVNGAGKRMDNSDIYSRNLTRKDKPKKQ